MFEKASRLQLRFDSPKGPLTVEDLWCIHLTSETGKANLDDIAKALYKRLKNDDNVSFVVAAQKSDETVQLAFDIVKHVIGVRLLENKAKSEEKERSERKQKILAIMADRKDESLRTMPLEDLEKLVAEM